MFKTNKAAVVIPIYKPVLSDNEIISLRQALSILTKWPIVFVCPDSIDRDYYLRFVKDKSLSISFLSLSPKFFENLEAYNRLMFNKYFYKKLAQYKYILIYQLDCLVFRDELASWCENGYSYIGAPWVRGNKLAGLAGNGGFSLRKVDDFINGLDIFFLKRKRMLSLINLYNRLIKTPNSGVIEVLRKYIHIYLLWLYFKINKMYKFKHKHKNTNEDIFYARYLPMFVRKFSVAGPGVSLKFAFEKSPEYLFKKNNNSLPFGCHGWPLYAMNLLSQQCPGIFKVNQEESLPDA